MFTSGALKNGSKKLLLSAFRSVLIIGICFIIFYPIFLKISVALRTREDLVDSAILFIPKNPTLDVFKQAYDMLEYSKAFFISLAVCGASALFHVISCTLTGYSLGRFRYPLRRVVFLLVILILMVPPQVISLPTYMSFRHFLGLFNLINNPAALFVLYLTANGLKSGLYIYLLAQFFKNMPEELEEAALVDGAGLFTTMFRVMIPNARTMLVTVFLFTFVWQWTDIYYSTMFFRDFDLLSVNLGLLGSNMQLYIVNVLGLASNPVLVSQMNNAGSILVILPLIVLYMFCSRFFVEGIERSGIVG